MKRRNLTNKKIGKLEIIDDFFEKIQEIIKCLCICDCGNLTIVRKGDLTKKRPTKSCGCLAKYSDPKKVSIVYVFKRYKRSSKKRNINFNLDLETFKKYIFKNCYYCDKKPSRKLNAYINNKEKIRGNRTRITKSRAEGSWIIYNGVDRKNNNLGYTAKNCVTCCWNCNRSKWNMSAKEYINHCRKVIKHYEKN